MNEDVGDEWSSVAGRRQWVMKYGQKRIYACEQNTNTNVSRILCSTVKALRSGDKFEYHSRQIIAILRIRATSDRLQAIYSTPVINWALKLQQFDATIGYPGEGPKCKKCLQAAKKI